MAKNKFLRHLVQHTAWKARGICRLEKVLGNFAGWGCLGKVLVRLHVRLVGSPGWGWYLEIA